MFLSNQHQLHPVDFVFLQKKTPEQLQLEQINQQIEQSYGEKSKLLQQVVIYPILVIKTISPLFAPSRRFTPTCSEYATEAIKMTWSL